MRTLALALSLLALTLSANYTFGARKGTNYYVDSVNGKDSNTGTSPDKAFKSLSRAGDIKLAPGDSLLFKRNCSFNGTIKISAKGTPDNRITIGSYGDGETACLSAPDGSAYTVYILNSDYLTVENLEIVNTGSKALAKRTGVLLECANKGVSHGITLNSLYVHDVNGMLTKKDGGGSGILVKNWWEPNKQPSLFDGLLIENCVVRRCERNGIVWSSAWNRKNWFPSKNVVVRGNLIEGVPGDGILVMGCDGAIIEYNLMRDCPGTLPAGEVAVGMWPWSCDNTTIRFNEVGDHKAPWDGQAFDSDYNCRNTHIEYNYGYNNDGGFLLVCNYGGDTTDNIGNIGTVARYNISYGDGVRNFKTPSGWYSPTVRIGGPCEDTLIENNIFFVTSKPSSEIDRHVIKSDSWEGYADKTTFRKNVFFTEQKSAFDLTKSTNNVFDKNYFYGKYKNKPKGKKGGSSVKKLKKLIPTLLTQKPIANGKAILTTVDKEAIEKYFKKLK